MTDGLPGLFVSGRQHSGNTVVCECLDNHPDVFVDRGENLWFERRATIEAGVEPATRVRRTVRWLLRKKRERAREVERELLDWAEARPDASAYDLFRRAMALVAGGAGKRAWVLKGTSYIFHAEEILREVPEARLVYMLRNPLDLAASTYARDLAKSRGGEKIRSDWAVSVAFGWTRGARRARALEARHPGRFLVVRYEDLVRDPAALEPVCDLLGIAFDPDLALVPHINRSDRGNKAETGPKGLNASRVFYWDTVLSPARSAAVWALVPGDLLAAEYPELADRAPDPGWTRRAAAGGHLAVCAARLARRQAGALAREPAHAVRRLARRLRT